MPKLRPMKTLDAISYFGGKPQLAAALGIRLPSLYDWGDIVPLKRQFQIQQLTGGALRATLPALPNDREAA